MFVVFAHAALGVGVIGRQVVAHQAALGLGAVLVRVDADPRRAGLLIVHVQHGVVHDPAVARAEQGDAVPVIGEHHVVLDHPVDERPVEAAHALQARAQRLVRILWNTAWSPSPRIPSAEKPSMTL
jgi:hypothetical protein